MGNLKTLQMDIAASLFMKPCTFEVLMERDFLKNTSEYGVEIQLKSMEMKGWIYFKNDKYFTYKSTVKNILNPEGYELE